MLDEAIRAWVKEYGLSPEQVEAKFQASVENAQRISELERKIEQLTVALMAQDIHWAMLARHHPHLVGEQRDDIRIALGATQDR